MSEGDKKSLDASTLKSLFAQSSLGKDDSKDMKLTDKEKEGFTKAFEDPEFRKMFAEYMDEMQDPKYRAETDEYIRQLEKEEKVPEGKELIHPLPGFVAKTHKMDDKGTKLEKLWMNITSSDRVMEPRKQVVKGDMGNARKEFKDLLVRTAMEGVTESYKRQNSPVKLSSDFHVLKGVSYKTGITTAMMVDKKSKETWKGEKGAPKTGGGEAVPSSGRVEELPPTPAASEQGPKKQPSPSAKKDSTNKKKEPLIKKGFLLGKGGAKVAKTSSPTPSSLPPPPTAAAESAKPAMTAVSTTKKESSSSSTISSNSLEPAYDVVERGVVDLGDFELTNSDGSTSEKARSTRPRELVVKIKLPKIPPKGIADVNLDISEKKLSLKYKDVYDLQLPLAYPVNDSAGSAKYEKNSQCLVVTLPVKANILALPARKSEPEVQQVDREGNPVEDPVSEQTKAKKKASPKKTEGSAKGTNPSAASDTNKRDKKNTAAPRETVSGGAEAEGGENSSGLMSLGEQEVNASRTLQEEIAAGAAKAVKEAKATKKSNPVSKKVPAAAKAPKAAEAADPNARPFIASDSFDGRKAGYVFKRGDDGVGYYLDTFGKRRTAKEGKPAATDPVKTALSDKHLKSDATVPAEVPPFEYRQTPHAFSVIIKVPGVLSSSTSVEFSSRSVRVTFQAQIGESHESKQAEGASCKTKAFAMSLCFPDTLPPAFELDCSRSSFDVAEENVVLVLMKKSNGIWPETKDAAGALLQGKSLPAAHDVKDKNKGAATNTRASEQPVDRLAAKAREMKLNDTSATALYELD